jgi:hypothetical protein
MAVRETGWPSWHQEFKQSEFLWAEIDAVASAAHGVTDAVDFKISTLENRSRRPASSAECRANARCKFCKNRRFCDVIVRPSVKPANALFAHAGAGHDYHRRIRPFGANSTQDIPPAGSRQIEIQDHEIVRMVEGQLMHLRSIGDYLYGELLLFQPLVQKFRQRRIIFSDKNAHRLTQIT